MNRRQVLFGASAAALAFGGFVPMPSSAGPVHMDVTFEPFTLGIQGSYTLYGAVMLNGEIPYVLDSAGAKVPVPAVQGSVVQQPAAPVQPAPPAAVPVQNAAPARPPMMSIVPVQRGTGARAARYID